MTEAEWLACTDPAQMLEFLRDKASDRKLRLFAAACCRRIVPQLKDESCRRAIDLIEQLAETAVGDEAILAAWQLTRDHSPSGGAVGHERGIAALALHHALSFADDCWTAVRYAALTAAISCRRTTRRSAGEAAAQCPLLRDIIGNPVAPVTANPAWRTEAACALAEAIYAERAFDRLPILADALEDAGCDNRAVLDNCRMPGEHVRGCWVVDLVLGKE